MGKVSLAFLCLTVLAEKSGILWEFSPTWQTVYSVLCAGTLLADRFHRKSNMLKLNKGIWSRKKLLLNLPQISSHLHHKQFKLHCSGRVPGTFALVLGQVFAGTALHSSQLARQGVQLPTPCLFL